MCEVLDKTRRKSFTGYKAVIEVEGKYYSPSTGYKYKLGKLPNMRKRTEFADSDWNDIFNEKNFHSFYDEKMQGKTGVFKSIKDLKEAFEDGFNYSVIKMTLGGEIYDGIFDRHYIIIGSEITKIEKTKLRTNEEIYE